MLSSLNFAPSTKRRNDINVAVAADGKFSVFYRNRFVGSVYGNTYKPFAAVGVTLKFT